MKLIIFIGFLVGGGIAVYLLVPFGDIFKKPSSSSNDDSGPTTTTSAPPSPAPVAQFEFNQCAEGAPCCNGLEENCDSPVNEVLFGMLHNAHHTEELRSNHDAPFEEALNAGYRGINMDICLCDTFLGSGVQELIFCHGFCGIGEQDIEDVFTKLDTFLDDNPNEVIVFNLEVALNKPSLVAFWQKIKGIGNIKQRSYNHDETAGWPTMQKLIDDDKRLLLFHHNGPDCSVPGTDDCPARIAYWFQYVYETDYSFDSVEAVEDFGNSCAATRGVDSTRDFYHINNFISSLIGPSESGADVINEKSFLETRVDNCEQKTGLQTSFLSIDFWQRGDLLEVVHEENKSRTGRRLKQNDESRFLRWR